MPANTPAPVVLVILAALLISCNVLWLYTTPDNTPRSVCGYLMDNWSGGRNSVRGKDPLNVSSAALPGVHDYQLVRGSGLTDVPFPIPIPNDTVILGDDTGNDDGLRQRFMTIGIASVWRKEEYLHRTLDSLLRETSQDDKREIFIFLLLADADPDVRQSRARVLEAQYRPHIQSGIIRVLQPPGLLYPSIDFSTIRRTYNDSVSRVQWRTKQVLDFAFLFWYAWTRQPSTYYLILEDDVLAARHFVTAVRDFVALHSKREWIALQLSGFMGIGQLIRCKDLDRLVSFLLLFYKEHPVDLLFSHWVSMMVPQKAPKDCPYRRIPGLFQHVGIHSTLANKTQTLRDSTFSLVRRRFSHVNPPAEVVTTIRQYKSFVARLAYSSAPGMFWGVPKAGDTYDIVFTRPLLVSRIVIVTGATITKKKTRDKLLFGQLQVSPSYERMLSPKRALCSHFVAIKEFQNGEVDAKELNKHFLNGIQCIRVVIGSKQRTWISISEIAVFTDDSEQNTIAYDSSNSDNEVDSNPASITSDRIDSAAAVKPTRDQTKEISSEVILKSEVKQSKLKSHGFKGHKSVAPDSANRVVNDRNSTFLSTVGVEAHGGQKDPSTVPNTARIASKEVALNATSLAEKYSSQTEQNAATPTASQKDLSEKSRNVILAASAAQQEPSNIAPTNRKLDQSINMAKSEGKAVRMEENLKAEMSRNEELDADIQTNYVEESNPNSEYNKILEPDQDVNQTRLHRLRKLRSILLNSRNSSSSDSGDMW